MYRFISRFFTYNLLYAGNGSEYYENKDNLFGYCIVPALISFFFFFFCFVFSLCFLYLSYHHAFYHDDITLFVN